VECIDGGPEGGRQNLLPSLVLKGDVLLELNMALMKDPGRTFRPLVEKLLARI
jgi:hypothetical protein